jgi:hypothetical protein
MKRKAPENVTGIISKGDETAFSYYEWELYSHEYVVKNLEGCQKDKFSSYMFSDHLVRRSGNGCRVFPLFCSINV